MWSIADVLDATVDEVIVFLDSFPDSRHARNARSGLALLQEVGLGYLRLGQPINTLSGGESQRLKLVSHLAGLADASSSGEHSPPIRLQSKQRNASPGAQKPTLFLFDEPTTGLHFDDVRILIQVFQRLVDSGDSVLVIEHNLDVVRCADWIIDLGPEAGNDGGRLVACGTPEQVAACDASHTGRFLRPLLARS
jgi:excinuclease ABC subunit A